MKLLLWPIATVLLLASCTTLKIEPVPSSNVLVTYDRGVASPRWSDDAAEMTVRLSPDGYELMVKLTVKNKTAASMRVGDADFAVEHSTDGKNWKPVKTISSEEYLSREKSRYATGMAMMVMGAVLDSEPTRSTTYTRVYGNRGSGVVISTTTIRREPSYYRNAWAVESYASEGSDRIQMLENNLFFIKDLAPGEEYFGLVFSESVGTGFYRVTCQNPGFHGASVQFKMTKKRYFPGWTD